MLEQVLGEIHNWVVREVIPGEFEVAGGQLRMPEGRALQDGQYLRVVGSVFADGLHQWPVEGLPHDERFEGEVWALAVPQEVVDLAGVIDDWDSKKFDYQLDRHCSKTNADTPNIGLLNHPQEIGTAIRKPVNRTA